MVLSLAFVVNLLVALLLLWVLWYVVKQFAPPDFHKIADVIFMVLFVIVLISALTGHVPLRLMT